MDPNVHSTTWRNFGILIDRYESIIASVGYKYIEDMRWNMYGQVGKAYVGGSADVDVGEGCTVHVACVCERGF